MTQSIQRLGRLITEVAFLVAFDSFFNISHFFVAKSSIVVAKAKSTLLTTFVHPICELEGQKSLLKLNMMH